MQKKILIILVPVLILAAVIILESMFRPEQKPEPDAAHAPQETGETSQTEDESAATDQEVPVRSEYVVVSPLDDSRKEFDDSYETVHLNAEEFVKSFYAYLKAGKYEIAAGYIHPDHYLEYFLEDASLYYDKIQEFGDLMTFGGSFREFEILEVLTIDERSTEVFYRVHTRDTVADRKLVLVTEQDLHTGAPVQFINMSVEQIIDPIDSIN